MSSKVPHLILVVDDDHELGKVIARDLEDRGFRVLLAKDGSEAWELLLHGGEVIEAVVTDIQMPNLDGLGLAERMRGLPNPPPVVFISGRDQHAVTPAQPFLFKPFDPDDLATLLRQLL
jgi:two-component system, LytTR family, response regulator AlgR